MNIKIKYCALSDKHDIIICHVTGKNRNKEKKGVPRSMHCLYYLVVYELLLQKFSFSWNLKKAETQNMSFETKSNSRTILGVFWLELKRPFSAPSFWSAQRSIVN